MPTITAIRYGWAKARKELGLENDPWFVFHACRHTCATRLVEKNVNVFVIQRFMGHKRIETTKRYAHVSDEQLQGALQQVENILDVRPPLPQNRPPKPHTSELDAERGLDN
jgi:integrase